MKVLNIQPFDYFGSIQRRSLKVALELRKKGIKTVFLIPKTVEKENIFSIEAAVQGFRVYQTSALRPIRIIDAQSLARMFIYLISFPRTLVQLYKLFKIEAAQVIQINGLICIQEAIATCLLAKKKGMWVLISDLYPRVVIFILFPLIRFINKRVFVCKKLINFYLGIKQDAVIYEPIETTIFNPENIGPCEKENIAQKFEIDKKLPLIISVGILSPRKGFVYLIKAFAIIMNCFPNAKLLIIGDILSSKKRHYFILRNLIKSLRLEKNIIITGYVKHKELLGLLSLADLFVMASLQEGTPVSILEAMAMKLPVVATDIGGISEQVTDETGILVLPKNHEAIAQAIIKLLHNKNKRSDMGIRARKRAHKIFSVETCIMNYKKVYDNITNAKECT